MSPIGSARGYVLMEVLVAASLLGIALVALLEGFGVSVSDLTYLQDRWTAVMLARRVAANPVDPTRRGNFEMPYDRFHWKEEGG